MSYRKHPVEQKEKKKNGRLYKKLCFNLEELLTSALYNTEG